MYQRAVSRILLPYRKTPKFLPQVQLFPRYVQTAAPKPKKIEPFALPTEVSTPSIKKTLEKNGCSFEDGFTCIATRCVNCHHEKGGTLYINKVTGFYMCMECQDYGTWENIEKKISSTPAKETTESTDTKALKKKQKKISIINEGTEKWNELNTTCKSTSTLTSDELQNIFSSFQLNASNPEILNEFNVLVDQDHKNLYFPLFNGNKRIVGVKQLTRKNKEECFPAKQCMGMIKYVPNKVRRKCDSSVLVLSLQDAISLSAMKPNLHIIYLPHGSLTLPQEILPMLENYQKLTLWFGNDTQNLETARMFSKKLGEQRCFLVRKTDQSPSEFIGNKSYVDVNDIIQSAQPIAHPSITTFSNLREDIWSELTNSDQAQGIKWKRFPALNEYLRGHRRGELTVLTGPTGCGKTTFISEYSLDLAMQGVSTLWGSFEIRNQRLALTMLQQMVGAPLNEDLEQFNVCANEFEKLPLFFLKFHGAQPVKKVMEVVEHATYVHDIQHLIIDNLQFMMGLSVGTESHMDRFYKQDLVIATFRTFATQHNCHVTLIIHPRKEKESDELSISSIFGGAKASQEADNILIIQKKMLESLHIKKYVQVAKNRYTGELGIMPLNFCKASRSFASKSFKEKST